MVVGPVTDKKVKRSTIRNASIIGGCIVVLLVVVFSGKFTVETISEKSEQKTQSVLQGVSSQVARIVATPIDLIRKQLGVLAQDEAIITLFAKADAIALETEGEQRKIAFESALKLRLFLPGQYEVDRETQPPISFASIDLLRRAERSTASIETEVHSLGGDGAHIAFVSRVTDAENNLVGLLHLSMPLSVIESVISTIDIPEVYIEVQQGKFSRVLTLTQFGNVSLRNGSPVSVGIEGTKWNVVSWNDVSTTVAVEIGEPAAENSGMGLIIFVLLILATGIGGFAFYRHQQLGARLEDKVVKQVVYEGAVKALMIGEHPGLERLVPDLPKSYQSTTSMSGAPPPAQVSRDDVTAIFKPSEILSDEPEKSIPKQKSVVQSTDDAMQTGIIEPEKRDNKEPGEDDPIETHSGVLAQIEISPLIFRAYDIRGVVDETLSAEVVHVIGRAIGSEAYERGQQSVIVARDGRISSPELGDALIAGLRASGRDVIDIGIVPTPVLYFATHHLETNSGVMLTGSHNGPEYNGLKIVLDGETLSGDAINAIRNRIDNNEMSQGQGNLQVVDIAADYLRRITDDIPVALGGAFRIIVDCGNGVAGQLAPQLYRAMGHDVVELFCDIDGTFPNHHPDPSQPENLQTLIEVVKEEGADLGFAFDGDGDRLGIVDGKGNIIWPDRQMMLFAKDVLSRNQGASIIFDVKCSRYLKEIIESSGGKPLMWKTGHSLIKSKMKEVDAPLAGEMSGHIFFKERWFGFDDALYAGARVLEILTNSKESPAETFSVLPEGLSTPELRIPLAEKDHVKVMQVMEEKMAFEDANVTDIDGLRVDFSDGWGLVRPSNTSPFLVARFEAESEASLQRIQTEFRDLLHSISADLKLPF